MASIAATRARNLEKFRAAISIAPTKGAREPNGRPSRRIVNVKEREAMTEAEAKSVVIAARVRHGIPAAYADLTDAGRPNAGTLQGRMRLNDELTADQWTAAEWFIGRRARYLRAVGAPGRPVEPAEHADGTGGVTIQEAIDEWTVVLACIRDASVESRSPIGAALDVMLVRQEHMAHMVGDLRLGLNAIHRCFLVGKRAGP